MGFVHCCGALRRCETYSLVPEDGYLIAEADVLELCPVCENYIVQLTRVDFNHQISTVRKSNLKARKLFENIQTSILYKQKYKYSPANDSKGKFYLNYNEFGVKKRCYSNLSRLQMGKSDFTENSLMTNPIRDPLKLEKFENFAAK